MTPAIDDVPHEPLELHRKTAQGNTGGSQATRNFLFWPAGRADPTGYRGDGGLELRRFNQPQPLGRPQGAYL